MNKAEKSNTNEVKTLNSKNYNKQPSKSSNFEDLIIPSKKLTPTNNINTFFSKNSYGNELALTALNTINSNKKELNNNLDFIENKINTLKQEGNYLEHQYISKKTETLPKLPIASAYESHTYSNCNEIFKNDNEGSLFLGDFFAATNMKDIKSKNIKAVLTMASGLNVTYKNQNFFEKNTLSSSYNKFFEEDFHINHLVIPALDIESYNISKHFEKTYSFIDENLKRNMNVLVHCAAGVSRSASVVIAYIMKRYIY